MRYAGVIKNDVVNGQGVCVSFWTQYCPHHCEGCHNPQTWSKDGGYELPDDYIDKIIGYLRENGVHRNLSILGGEPLCEYNYKIVYDLLKAVKEKYPDTKVFVWTGSTFNDVISSFPKIIKYIDILVDGQFELNKRDITLPLRGSSNQRIIDVKGVVKQVRRGIEYLSYSGHAPINYTEY